MKFIYALYKLIENIFSFTNVDLDENSAADEAQTENASTKKAIEDLGKYN